MDDLKNYLNKAEDKPAANLPAKNPVPGGSQPGVSPGAGRNVTGAGLNAGNTLGQEPGILRRTSWLQLIIPSLVILLTLFFGYRTHLLGWLWDFSDYGVYIGVIACMAMLILLTFDYARQRAIPEAIGKNLLIIASVFLIFALMWRVEQLFLQTQLAQFGNSVLLYGALLLCFIFLIIFKSVFTRMQTVLAILLILSLVAGYGYYFKYFSEVRIAKEFFSYIIKDTEPAAVQAELLDASFLQNLSYQDAFYIFKVWFIQSGTSELNLKLAYATNAYRDGDKVNFDLYYGHHNPVIQCSVYPKEQGGKIVSLSFPLYKHGFTGDVNGDGKYDQNDVATATSQAQNRHK